MSQLEQVMRKLVGLSGQDRAAVLASLTPASRRALAAHLAANATTGPVTATLAPLAVAGTPEAPAPTFDAVEKLLLADPAAVAEILANEPAWVSAAILASHAWPWEGSVTSQLPPRLRSQVKVQANRIQIAIPVRQALLAGLAGKLPGRGPTATSADAESASRPLARRRTRWWNRRRAGA